MYLHCKIKGNGYTTIDVTEILAKIQFRFSPNAFNFHFAKRWGRSCNAETIAYSLPPLSRKNMASSESSIVSKLNLEMEQQLLQLFSKPVRLHLLFQASRHGFRSSLQNRFDEVGKFIIIVYLKTNEARGAYFSKSGKTYSKWFLFDLTSKRATSIPNQSEDETYKEPWSYGNAMNLRDEWVNSQFYVDFSSDEKYNTGWKTESIVCRKGSLIDLEMFRVHGEEPTYSTY